MQEHVTLSTVEPCTQSHNHKSQVAWFAKGRCCNQMTRLAFLGKFYRIWMRAQESEKAHFQRVSQFVGSSLGKTWDFTEGVEAGPVEKHDSPVLLSWGSANNFRSRSFHRLGWSLEHHLKFYPCLAPPLPVLLPPYPSLLSLREHLQKSLHVHPHLRTSHPIWYMSKLPVILPGLMLT